MKRVLSEESQAALTTTFDINGEGGYRETASPLKMGRPGRSADIPELIGRAPAFLGAVSLIWRLAKCEVCVLVSGETGTGKELAARAIHYLGGRRNLPFIPVNCGALPDMLVESELFGHVRGAFTDARDAQQGLVAQADGGTLFLDEIDSLSPKAQVALLRFLQDGNYRPVGGQKYLTSKARVIAATNANLGALVRRGLFREDLFFRLSVVPLTMPALRDRPGDASLLARTFMSRLAAEYCTGPRDISSASLALLERYSWPGNVRELANYVQREFLLSDDVCLQLSPASLDLVEDRPERPGMTASFRRARQEALASFEREFLRRALAQSQGNISLAARCAETERRNFGRLLKKHGIDRNDFMRV